MPQAAPETKAISTSIELPRSQRHDRRSHRGRRGHGRERPETAPQKKPTRDKFEPGGSTVHKAVEELNNVVDSLQKTLRELEDALHLLETAEEQKDYDEQELESLRHAMGQLKQARKLESTQSHQPA